jgi:hypothetical protein
MAIKVKVFREKGKESGYQELASRLYDEVHELSKQLAATSSAHALTLESCLKQSREIDRLTHQLAEATKQLGTTHVGLIEVQDREESAASA